MKSSAVDEILWNAVLRRDRALDGKFVYAALTTGIYCRPSCPARHPHRRNTLFFKTVAQAEREGFIACRRCHPRSNSLTSAEISIKAALDYIEAHAGRGVTLASLSRATGLSPNHFQQTFNKIMGLSPKAFCDARRLVHLKRRLKQGEAVISATYAAGYGSSRALYEQAGKGLGMTPAIYARGGAGMHIRYAVLGGTTLIAMSDRGVCAVLRGEDEKTLVGQLQQEFPSAVLLRNPAPSPDLLDIVSRCRATGPFLSQLSPEILATIFLARVTARLKSRFGKDAHSLTIDLALTEKRGKLMAKPSKSPPRRVLTEPQRLAMVRRPVEDRWRAVKTTPRPN